MVFSKSLIFLISKSLMRFYQEKEHKLDKICDRNFWSNREKSIFLTNIVDMIYPLIYRSYILSLYIVLQDN